MGHRNKQSDNKLHNIATWKACYAWLEPCGRELEGTGDNITLWRNPPVVRRVEAPGGFGWKGLSAHVCLKCIFP